MKEYIRLGLTLLIISAIAAGALALLNSATAPIIAENAKLASYGKYFEVLGENVDIEEVPEEELAKIQENYPEIGAVLTYADAGEAAGYIFTTKSSGYGGEMENAIIINNDGTIAGYRNLSNSETPGFGKAIEEESYYSRYDGKSIANSDSLVLGSAGGENEIEAITGATISSKAVLDGLNKAVSAFKEISSGN